MASGFAMSIEMVITSIRRSVLANAMRVDVQLMSIGSARPWLMRGGRLLRSRKSLRNPAGRRPLSKRRCLAVLSDSRLCVVRG
jgi:hypothetical protein